MLRRIRAPLIAAMIITAAFVGLSVTQGNDEFLFYAAALAAIIAALHFTDELFCYKEVALWGFSAWALLHLLGGFAVIDGTRLYDLILVDLIGDPYGILRYDQLVHVFCYVVAALLLGSVVEGLASASANHWLLGLVTVLAAVGVGALNEVVEFVAFTLVAESGVGGYVNTALDLVANLLGALIGTSWYHASHR